MSKCPFAYFSRFSYVKHNNQTNQTLNKYNKPSSDKIYSETNTSGTYYRSACPVLNILANHSYINNIGTDITINHIADACNKVFGVSKFSLYPILYLTKYKCGLGDKFNLHQISSHNKIEHDVSLFHYDYSENYNQHILDESSVDDFINIVKKNSESSDNKDTNGSDSALEFTKADIEEHYQNRLKRSELLSNFKYGQFQKIASFSERYLLYNVLVKSHKIKDLKTLILEEKLPEDYFSKKVEFSTSSV